MLTFNINLAQLQIFFLVLLRLGAIFMSIPIFGGKNIPIVLKAGFAISVSIILFPILEIKTVPYYSEVIPFGIGAVSEIMLGVAIGLLVNLLFTGIQLAGQLAGYQMGFALANVMDPQTGQQSSILAGLHNMIAMLLFLAFNAHHWFLLTLADSFEMVPILNFKINSSLVEHFIMLSGNMFIVAIKVAAPVMAVLLVSSVCLGLIARTVPRMNVFLVGMPLKIALGLFFVVIALPYLASFLKQIFMGLGDGIILILKAV
jgi:flagellar biosynthetic protein FliR